MVKNNDNDKKTKADLIYAVVNFTTAPPNPIPAISSLSPSSATEGGAGFTLTVNGSSFVSGSVVRWNNSDRVTNFVDSTTLEATVPAGDITLAGTRPVTVFNPLPGGGTSGALTFTINAPPTPPSVQEIALQVKEGYDEKNLKTLSEDGKLTFVQTNDTDRFETISQYFTSFEFDSFSFPTTAVIQSVEISVVHYEEDSFGVDNLEWDAGVGLLTNPTILLVRNPPLLIDESSEGLEVFDVSSVIDTPAKLNDLKFVVQNNDLANDKKTYLDHIFVTVRYTE